MYFVVMFEENRIILFVRKGLVNKVKGLCQWLLVEREREGTMAVYYTSPQSYIKTFSYSLA